MMHPGSDHGVHHGDVGRHPHRLPHPCTSHTHLQVGKCFTRSVVNYNYARKLSQPPLFNIFVRNSLRYSFLWQIQQQQPNFFFKCWAILPMAIYITLVKGLTRIMYCVLWFRSNKYYTIHAIWRSVAPVLYSSTFSARMSNIFLPSVSVLCHFLVVFNIFFSTFSCNPSVLFHLSFDRYKMNRVTPSIRN